MDYFEMNQRAWEIAALSMMPKGRDVAAYSTTQMRKFFALAQQKDEDIPRKMNEAIQSYTPQPARSQGGMPDRREQQNLAEQRKKNAVIGEKVIDAFTGMDAGMRTRFIQYLMWDVKIIEQGFSMYPSDPLVWIKKLLDAEGISRQEQILNDLKSLFSKQDGSYDDGGMGRMNVRDKRRW
jgi:hypothetical protein